MEPKTKLDKPGFTGLPSTVTVPPLPLTTTVSVNGGAAQAAAGLALMTVSVNTANRQINTLKIFFFNFFFRWLPALESHAVTQSGRL
jgi:hypothetical protein